MRLSTSVAPASPGRARAAAAVPPAVASAPAAPSKATASGTDIKVITYNTAVGNGAIKTKQADFLQLPFYRDVIEGKPDAPILCLQEVGNAQRDAVKKLARSGNFQVFYQHVGVQNRQGNMILVPKRFQVQGYESTHFGLGHVKAAAQTLWGWLRGKVEIPDFKDNFVQLLEPRGYQMAKLLDTRTGKPLTLFNAHMSYYDPIKLAHAKQLFGAAKQAERSGPVIVAGDLNTRTADTDPNPQTSGNAKVRAEFGDFVDMGPKGKPPGKTNIDWVLGQGFESVSSRWYTGRSISLPGSPDALTVSDHYAEEDVLRYQP